MELAAVEEIFNCIKSRIGCSYQLREEQKRVVKHLLDHEDVLCILPTGYGKSECFVLPPLILEEISAQEKIVIVISPLRSLMQDLKKRLLERNIRAACILRADEIDQDTKEGLLKGGYSVVFSSPEAMLSGIWRTMLQSQTYKDKLCMFACDEVHCITEWGESFRPAYMEVAALRALVDVPLLLTTATLTPKIVSSLKELFEVPEIKTVAVVPDRPNIFINFKCESGMKFEEELAWVAELLKTELENCPKMIVYCRTVSDALNIYEFLVDGLLDMEKKFLVQLYHSEIYCETEGQILAEFPEVSSNLRVLVSTIAFGMGVSIPDIQKVIHWGASKSVLSYWQEVGRCGRDGRSAQAYLYATKTSLDKRRTDDDMINLCRVAQKEQDCIRMRILNHLTIPDMNMSILEGLSQRQQCNLRCVECSCEHCCCCSNCKQSCTCTKS